MIMFFVPPNSARIRTDFETFAYIWGGGLAWGEDYKRKSSVSLGQTTAIPRINDPFSKCCGRAF